MEKQVFVLWDQVLNQAMCDADGKRLEFTTSAEAHRWLTDHFDSFEDNRYYHNRNRPVDQLFKHAMKIGAMLL